ncbi:hypothetical protein [Tsukamurella sp. 1534]|uniref:hypothetical protein n=1 Tax=Tsukamurella sp. 1534 TaxID=1151061 RepID=UPI0002D72022|nr:hypothetical protein [Tsukamurella sp. 1534]
MTTYRVNVHRDDRWWMIEVPELDGHRGPDGIINVGDTTQARHYSDIEKEARDFICTVVDVAPSAVDLDVHIDVEGLDIAAAADEIASARATAKEAEARAVARSSEVAAALSSAGVPMRDIGEIVGVSHQRVDQLINKTVANPKRKVAVTTRAPKKTAVPARAAKYRDLRAAPRVAAAASAKKTGAKRRAV